MTEGVTTAQPIKVQFQRTQNPFTLTLHPVSHREAIDDFHVDNFIIDPPQSDVEMATSGNELLIRCYPFHFQQLLFCRHIKLMHYSF